MNNYVCIHGHFYQPPRENAWLEYIEMQDSAYPYHDWNQRVTAECYAPNTASRILDGEGYITHIVNNYKKLSFDFGPTLLAWLKEMMPDIYQAVIDADRETQQTFSGHGSAIAQPYNHMIMPLATHRDKYTQIIWAIKDFEYHFGRKPEGIWLPETAVDLRTLDILAEQEIRFTILAPHQARRVRQFGATDWTSVRTGKINTAMAYEIKLPSNRKLALFFYDGPIARSVAFEDLLKSGDNLAHRLASAFRQEQTDPQLVHIATDGETYGHHHRFGDMALAFAFYHIEANNLAQITNYGEYLEKHPPTYEVEIIENTSWSCLHGIERWRSDCGCSTGRNPKWNQAWRAPLREALDWLRDTLAPKYEERANHLLKDPWAARNDYIKIILDRTPDSIHRFFEQHSTHELNEGDTTTALKLLELQRQTMLMYTSCGWFFEELSGIETVQVIQFAGRAVQLAKELFGDNIEQNFLSRLELAKSNIPEHGDGSHIYDNFVKPAMIDLTKVTAHFAVSSLFEEYNKQARIYCYNIDLEDFHKSAAGKAKLTSGRVRVTSEITKESALLGFGALHFGGHNVNAGVRDYQGDESYQIMLDELTQTFTVADFPGVIRLLDKHFGMSTYSMRDLFRDEQRKVLDSILESALAEIEVAYQQVYEHHYPPMRFLSEIGNPIPKSFQSAAEFIMNSNLRRAISGDHLDQERIRDILNETQMWQVELDNEGLSYIFQQAIERIMARFVATPDNADHLGELLGATEMLSALPFPVDLWQVQNLYHQMLMSTYVEHQTQAQQGNQLAKEWLASFTLLGNRLSIKVS